MNKKNIVTLLVVVVPIIIIICIIIFIGLKMISANSYSKSDNYSGRFDKVVVDEEFIVNRYFMQIAEMIKNSDISSLQSIIDKNDPKYYIMGSGDFLEVLENNGLYGVNIELIRFNRDDTFEIDGLEVYQIYIKSEKNGEEKHITLKTEYPDEYTIVLDF